MKQRRIGSTELNISEIGFGCGGNAGLMVSGEYTEQLRVIARALECGITYFDNAPDYGAGAAEVNLGRVLKELGADPVINTKVEIRAENLGDIAGHIERSVEESLRRLKRDAIDIVQIHNGPVAAQPHMEGKYYATLWAEDYHRQGGVLEGVHALLRLGKARHAGFVCRGDDIDEVRQLLDTGLFHMINVPYTLLNPSAGYSYSSSIGVKPDFGNVINVAKAAGCGVAVFSPLAGGVLTDAILRGQQTHPLARTKNIETLEANGVLHKARKFQALARRENIELVELAYRFILSNASVTTLLGGITVAEQLAAAVTASIAGPLPQNLLTDIETIRHR
ncbi:aldo/keto reductase [Phyllobacterium zundukense]|uniref:Aldo/keto reductase n=1 Tax=Phyllobacterium zundukense TaxID=1867719 RepID=A0ACD4DA03_9HYPH|nr:aldo/keto reductase [Phyllobacterium zundukense]UXN62553.1 aldo/keto reductase [Phyllobacterium zundukense]